MRKLTIQKIKSLKKDSKIYIKFNKNLMIKKLKESGFNNEVIENNKLNISKLNNGVYAVNYNSVDRLHLKINTNKFILYYKNYCFVGNVSSNIRVWDALKYISLYNFNPTSKYQFINA